MVSNVESSQKNSIWQPCLYSVDVKEGTAKLVLAVFKKFFLLLADLAISHDNT